MMDNFNRSSLYLDAPPCDSSTRSPYVTSMPRAGAVHLITIEPVENQRPHVGNTPIESPVPEVARGHQHQWKSYAHPVFDSQLERFKTSPQRTASTGVQFTPESRRSGSLAARSQKCQELRWQSPLGRSFGKSPGYAIMGSSQGEYSGSGGRNCWDRIWL